MTTKTQATDIYKRLLLENRDDLALNVYVAMCYYKLDYYDVSLEILAVYLQAFPDSAVAMNLKVRKTGKDQVGGERCGAINLMKICAQWLRVRESVRAKKIWVG